ncbi:hypothetical protein OIU84_015830 [Salix udensis]|uniref:Uncharacterized protein n=1 Tax=Salix udensis TaxID=889485 RepID=A0AAD6J7T2_9ROSI|nr:hypothetical protein OIU84_015830 [Salix udensis]
MGPLPQSHQVERAHNHNQGSTLNTQLPFEVTEFSTGGTGLSVHHPPVYQSGTTMGSGGLANENSPGLPQSHVSQGLTHLQWGMTPDNTFDTWEAGPPVHQPIVYVSETTIRPEGPAIEYPLELPQSHPPQGWPHENNFEQPDSTYGDQFIEFSGCSNNIDGSYI